jgi:hypothetical protein
MTDICYNSVLARGAPLIGSRRGVYRHKMLSG